MRIYKSAVEAQNEILRDLVEMGITNQSYSFQDVIVQGNPEFETKELMGYSYCLIQWNDIDKLKFLTKEWADAEFLERISPQIKNPGEAWKLRKEVWEAFLHNGRFAYTYNERMVNLLPLLIEELKDHPTTRQAYLNIFNADRDYYNLGGSGRVPCSLGYYFNIRKIDGTEEKLNMHYLMRSCDLFTHWANDVYLAIKLLEYVASEIQVKPGWFFHTVCSLHAFKKDFQHLGIF